MSITAVAGDGVRLTVRRRPGTGRRGILLLHGWPGNHTDWDHVFEALATDQRWSSAELLSPDLRGYGGSDRPPYSPDADNRYIAYAPSAHLADLKSLIDGASLDEVLVGGYDLGANLAQGLARTDARVAGLVLCDPVHPAARAQAATMNLATELWYQQLHLQPWAADLIGHDRQTIEIYLRHFYTQWWGEGMIAEDHFQAIVDDYARPGAFEASIAWYRTRASSRAAETAAAAATDPLEAPAVILWGESDPVTPVLFADSVGDSFSDCELRRLPGIGHFAPLEAPAEVAEAFDRLARRLGWIQAPPEPAIASEAPTARER